MIVVFDLETTGIDTQKDRIVQFAALKVDENFVEKERLVLDINPTIPISIGASRVHGLYDKDVRDCATFADVADLIVAFFEGCAPAGYNIIGFDIPLLDAELRRCGKKLLVGDERVIDAFAVYLKFEGGSMKGKNLTNAYKFYCEEELGDDAHNALSDTSATVAILEAQVKRYADHLTWPTESARDLYTWTMGAHVDLTGKFRWNEQDGAAITFGKHKGKTLRHLCKYARPYLRWMLRGNFSSEVQELICEALDGSYPVRLTPELESRWRGYVCSVCGQAGATSEPVDGVYVCSECKERLRDDQDDQKGKKEEKVVPEICDMCCGKAKTLTGDVCVCGDGTQSGLVRALRRQLYEARKDQERRDAQERVKDALLEDINEWMAGMGFDGHGFVLQQRIKRLYWPDLAVHVDRPTGTKCSVCGEPQYNSPSGVACKNGHGGAPAQREKEDM